MDVLVYQPKPQAPKKLSNKHLSVKLVIPGEVISNDIDYMRGHGTYVHDGKLISSVSGVLEKTNKLVSVKPLKSRYTGDSGDVVVGRIVDVQQNRWKVDIYARQHGSLMLGAVNLHGGIHRRRTDEDNLQMRDYYVEDDVIVAEVQKFFDDGSISLQVPRHLGKLEFGIFLTVSPLLIKRSKSHILSLDCGVDIIIGMNGYIWLSETLSEEEKEKKEAQGKEYVHKTTDNEARMRMTRVKNCIYVLSKNQLAIFPEAIEKLYKASLKHKTKELLKPDVMEQLIKVL